MVKSYEVVVTSKAEKDLENILLFLVEHVGYQTSEEVNFAIIESIKKLSTRPEKNGLFNTDIFPSRKYRRVIVKKAWNLIFQIDDEEQEVYVLRVLHVKRGDEFIRTALK